MTVLDDQAGIYHDSRSFTVTTWVALSLDSSSSPACAGPRLTTRIGSCGLGPVGASGSRRRFSTATGAGGDMMMRVICCSLHAMNTSNLAPVLTQPVLTQ
jgi:hypothetical protein